MADVKEKVGVFTDEISTAGRPIYKTPEGEMVSEKSTTFKYKGSWINIPTIHNGYSYDEEELRIMLDHGLVEPTSVHKNLKAAEKAAMSDVQKAEALNETNVQFEKAKSDLEVQRMQTAAQIEEQQMAKRFEYDMKLKQAELQNAKVKEKEIEDRKDERTRIQATQQSKMISQRQNDTLPTDFESNQFGGIPIDQI